MTKTIAQIQYEMETVKLIKSALDVNGAKAFELFNEWTTKEESNSIKNKFVINVDIKEIYTGSVPTFRKGDNVEFLFKFFEDKKPFNIDSATGATITYENANGDKIFAPCEFENLKGSRVVKYNFNSDDIGEGYLTLGLTVRDGNKSVSIHPFNVLVYK